VLRLPVPEKDDRGNILIQSVLQFSVFIDVEFVDGDVPAFEAAKLSRAGPFECRVRTRVPRKSTTLMPW